MVMKMKYYPIQKKFKNLFIEKENLLIQLIKDDSFQLNVILQRIDICDFSMRCINFYASDEYELKNNTIIYTSHITNEKSYCCIQNNAIQLSSKLGFDLFLERYFDTCFMLDGEEKWGWFTYTSKKQEENPI